MRACAMLLLALAAMLSAFSTPAFAIEPISIGRNAEALGSPAASLQPSCSW